MTEFQMLMLEDYYPVEVLDAEMAYVPYDDSDLDEDIEFDSWDDE